jgi:hypothetical protein
VEVLVVSHVGHTDSDLINSNNVFRSMASSGMLLRAALVRTDVSEDLSASRAELHRLCESEKLRLI